MAYGMGAQFPASRAPWRMGFVLIFVVSAKKDIWPYKRSKWLENPN
jgi:hypothetical protein